MGVETRRTTAGGRHKKTTPPIFSHEFVIQNHGDIMSCVLMVFIVGLMFPLSASMCSIFVAPQYNETVNVTSDLGPVSLTLYRNGPADVFTILFYAVAWIVVHAVIQEYILDKLQRKACFITPIWGYIMNCFTQPKGMFGVLTRAGISKQIGDVTIRPPNTNTARLSKVKTFKFTESGHMSLFALYSACHAAYVIMDFVHNYTDVKRIWLGYPEEHRWMNLNMKLFAILQIAYWVHQFPEFYFQKMKADEIRQRTVISVLHICFISAAYTMNFMRFAVILLALEYASQTVFHFSRLLHFLEKKEIAKNGFTLWNIIFLIVRLSSSVLTVMTFWYGLRQSESAYIDVAAGNYNTTYVRLNCLLVVLSLQLFQLWNFTSFHVGRFRENASRKAKSDTKRLVPQQKVKKSKTEDSVSENEQNDEVDANMRRGKKKIN